MFESLQHYDDMLQIRVLILLEMMNQVSFSIIFTDISSCNHNINYGAIFYMVLGVPAYG